MSEPSEITRARQEGYDIGYEEGYRDGKQAGILYAQKLAAPITATNKVGVALQEARREITRLNAQIREHLDRLKG